MNKLVSKIFHLCNCGKKIHDYQKETVFVGVMGDYDRGAVLNLYTCPYCGSTFAKKDKAENENN